MSVADELAALKENISSAYDAIETKGGTIPEKKNTENLASAIQTISGGGSSTPSDDDPVQFWDYDGTLLYSYTADEFLKLEEMPVLAQHEGLVPEGWNWSFEGARNYVEKYGACVIGETYETKDGATHIFLNIPTLHINQFRVQVRLGSSVSGTTPELVIDWGDGSTPDVVSGTGIRYAVHTYERVGEYDISVSINEGCYYIPCYLCCQEGTENSIDVTEIRLGADCRYGTNAYVGKFTSLERFSLPSTYYGNATLDTTPSANYMIFNHMLKALIVPSGIKQYAIWLDSTDQNFMVSIPESVKQVGVYNTGLRPSGNKWLTLPEAVPNGQYVNLSSCQNVVFGNLTSVETSANGNAQNDRLKQMFFNGGHLSGQNSYAFRGCYGLKNVVFNEYSTVTEIGVGWFVNCESLEEIKLPPSIGSIAKEAFQGCINLLKIDLTDCKQKVALENANAIPVRATVLVPKSLLEDYLADEVWATISDEIVGVE